MRVQSDSQVTASGSPASSARIDDQAPMGGRLVANGPETGELMAVDGSGGTGPARAAVVDDGPATSGGRRGSEASGGSPLASSLPTTALAVVALVGYWVVRLRVGAHDPLGVGLASVPLFFAAAFLTRRRTAAIVGLGTILVTARPDRARPGRLVGHRRRDRRRAGGPRRRRAGAPGGPRPCRASAAGQAAHEALLTDRLQAVLGIAERLTTTLDRDAILRTIVTEVNRALETDGTTIRILDDDRAVVVASAGSRRRRRRPAARSSRPTRAGSASSCATGARSSTTGPGPATSDRAMYGGIIDVQSSHLGAARRSTTG